MYKITGIPLRCCSYFTRDCHDCHVYCLSGLPLRPPGCLANQSTKTIFGPDRDYSHRTQNSWEKAQPNPYSSIDRPPRFKNIFAPSFHHSSNILIDQSCSPKAYRQPSTGRLQSFLMIGMTFTRALKQITKQNICWLFPPDFPLHQAGRDVCLKRTSGYANFKHSFFSTFK